MRSRWIDRQRASMMCASTHSPTPGRCRGSWVIGVGVADRLIRRATWRALR
jgi:hypothetical protein